MAPLLNAEMTSRAKSISTGSFYGVVTNYAIFYYLLYQ